MLGCFKSNSCGSGDTGYFRCDSDHFGRAIVGFSSSGSKPCKKFD